MGLVQNALEGAGLATLSLSTLPDFTRAAGAPRVAGIAYPMGRPLGNPGDADGQRAVLEAALRTVPSAREPGTIARLPFRWPGPLRPAASRAPEPPPIAALIRRRPWLYANLLRGEPPR